MKIFDDKKWDINDELFENFCNTLELLDEEQRKLVIELTKNFKSIGVESYYHYFISSFDKYIADISKNYQGKTNIFIIPLISNNDFGKIKSSTLLYYLLKSKSSDLTKRHKQKVFSVSLIDTTDYNVIDNRYIEQMRSLNSRICLIDDFVGSGESAVSAAEYLVRRYNLNKDKISVVSLVSMRQGIDELIRNNYKLYTQTSQLNTANAS